MTFNDFVSSNVAFLSLTFFFAVFTTMAIWKVITHILSCGLLCYYKLPPAFAVITSIIFLDSINHLQHLKVHAAPLSWRLRRVHYSVKYEQTNSSYVFYLSYWERLFAICHKLMRIPALDSDCHQCSKTRYQYMRTYINNTLQASILYHQVPYTTMKNLTQQTPYQQEML